MTLITGITGKSGSMLLRQIVRHGAPGGDALRFLVRPGSNTAALQAAQLNAEVTVGDLADEAFVRSAMQGVHTVLHITSILYSPVIVRAAVDAGVQRLVLVHTTGIYSRYKSASAHYLQIEHDIHALLQSSPSPPRLTILRPTMIYGFLHDHNVSVFIKMAHRLPVVPMVNGGRYALQPVHAADLGWAYYQLLAQPQKATAAEYILSGGAPVLLVDMFRIIGQKLGRRPRFLPVPFWLAFAGAWALYLLSFGRADYRERVQRLVEPRAWPHDDARADFGYAPRSFEEGVGEEVALYLASLG